MMKKIAFLFGLGLGVVGGIVVGVLTELDNDEPIPETAAQNYAQRLINEARRAARAQKEAMESKLAAGMRRPA